MAMYSSKLTFSAAALVASSWSFTGPPRICDRCSWLIWALPCRHTASADTENCLAIARRPAPETSRTSIRYRSRCEQIVQRPVRRPLGAPNVKLLSCAYVVRSSRY